MALSTKHPLYMEREPDWRQMRDTYDGERKVKAAGFLYLPATAGMIGDGVTNANQPGFLAYDSYRKRASCPEIVSRAVAKLLGMIDRKPAKFDLPTALEPMRERATIRGESLAVLLRRVYEEQLVMGRVGLIGDLVDQGPLAGQPYIALYAAEKIVNWDEGARDALEPQTLNLVVLDESENERQKEQGGFEWRWVEKYRVLVLGDPIANEPDGAYRVGVFREQQDFAESMLKTPGVRGRTLGKIPFVFANTKDVVPAPDKPPLLGLSNLTLTIYRGEADYRQALFQQGQDTLVIAGITKDQVAGLRVGANQILALPPNAEAKYVGVSSTGLPEQRQALANDYGRAQVESGEAIDSMSREKESGEALRTRVTAATATLATIARSGAFAVQSLLRILAEWVGANPDEVVVTPNLDFVDDRMAADDLGKLMAGKSLGGPLSLRSIHAQMRQRGLTDLEYEEELEAIEAEAEEAAALGAPAKTEEEPDDEDSDDEDSDDDSMMDDEE